MQSIFLVAHWLKVLSVQYHQVRKTALKGLLINIHAPHHLLRGVLLGFVKTGGQVQHDPTHMELLEPVKQIEVQDDDLRQRIDRFLEFLRESVVVGQWADEVVDGWELEVEVSKSQNITLHSEKVFHCVETVTHEYILLGLWSVDLVVF